LSGETAGPVAAKTLCACLFPVRSISSPRNAGCTGLLLSFHEADVGERAKSHVARATIQPEAVNPGPRSARAYRRMETGGVGMQANISLHSDLCFGELADKASTDYVRWAPHFLR